MTREVIGIPVICISVIITVSTKLRVKETSASGTAIATLGTSSPVKELMITFYICVLTGYFPPRGTRRARLQLL